MIPRPAVIHCTSPGSSAPVCPALSPCSSTPSSTVVTVSTPRCGCHSKPGEENQSSLSTRKGSVRRGASGPMIMALSSTWASGPSRRLVSTRATVRRAGLGSSAVILRGTAGRRETFLLQEAAQQGGGTVQVLGDGALRGAGVAGQDGRHDRGVLRGGVVDVPLQH